MANDRPSSYQPSSYQRNSWFIFCHTQHDRGFYTFHIGGFSQSAQHETLDGLQIAPYAFENVIGIARHTITFANNGPTRHAAFKIPHLVFGLAFKANKCDNFSAIAKLFTRQSGAVTTD